MWKVLLRPEQDRDVLSKSELRHPPVKKKALIYWIQVHDRCVAWRTRTAMTSRTWASIHDRKWEEFGVFEGKSTGNCSKSGRKLKKKVEDSGLIRGFHASWVGMDELCISHLLFAEDTMVMCDADTKQQMYLWLWLVLKHLLVSVGEVENLWVLADILCCWIGSFYVLLSSFWDLLFYVLVLLFYFLVLLLYC